MNSKSKDWHKLDIPEGKINDYAVKHKIMPAETDLQTGTARTAVFGQPIETIHFDYETRWHELSYDGGVWMTDLPIEQAQHDRELKPVEGNVLVGGLGLGYALTVLRDNPKVHNVTVVEKSQEVIDLVWPHLDIPRDRFKVVNQDLFEFLELYDQQGHGPMADYCFYDIWQSDSENTFFEVVCPLRRMTDEMGICPDYRIICWNEDVMRGQLAMGLHNRILFMQSTPISESIGVPTLSVEKLCEPRDKYHDWSIPFWETMRDKKWTPEQATNAIPHYVGIVGRSEDEYLWRYVADNIIV